MDTPAFLLWSIEYSCPIRGFQDGSDPERTERQLRAAREFGRARREGRVFEGLALAPPLGFRTQETLAFYGGEAALEAACADCPCNALASESAAALASCYGLVPLPADAASFYSAVDRAMESAGDCGLSDTTPCWFGLWRHTPLHAEQLLATFLILDATLIEDVDCREAIDELKLGLNAAFNAGRPLHVRLFPPGRVDGPWWRLAPYCPACQAAWSGSGLQTCAVCGYVGHPAPEKKRHARGTRPYFPLERLLGAERAAEVLRRYALPPGNESTED